jgi:hypothetical protein
LPPKEKTVASLDANADNGKAADSGDKETNDFLT